MALRPDVIVRQVFRTPSPAVATSSMPAVYVGIQRQLAYRQEAGTYLGGQANSYDFPDLISGSAVEPTEQTDAYLRPHVYISGEYGVAEVTPDVTFSNLDQSLVAPSFVIATDAEATFEVASGDAGDYSSTTGAFTDPAADFITGRVGAGDVIKLSGVPAFTVTALVSDDELTVTRVNHGPTDARVSLGAKDSQGARVLTYEGTIGQGFDGFITEGVRVGDAASFDEWTERTATLGLSYGAVSSGRRTLTVGGTQFTNAVIGDIVMTRNDENGLEPTFILTANSGASSRAANTVQGALADDDIAGSSGYPARYFTTKHLTTLRGSQRSTGYFDAQDTNGRRTFTDTGATFAVSGVAQGDWIVVYAADSTSLAGVTVAAGSLTRGSGSWLTDGFTIGMKVLIVTATQSANKVETTVTDVTDLVLSVSATLSTVTTPDTVRVVSADMTPMFEVYATPSGATSVTVTDLAHGVLTAAAVGGPLRYSIFSVTTVSGGSASGANVSIEGTIQTSGKRYVQWPTAFVSGSTLPVAGDVIYSDNGVRLFDVVTALVTPQATTGGLVFTAGVTDTIVAQTGGSCDFSALGYAAGDYIQVINSENGGENDAIFKILSIGGTGNKTITVVGSGGSAATPPFADAGVLVNTTASPDTTAVIQKLVVSDNANPGFAMGATDLITGGYLSVRSANAAAYEVIRVNSETEIVVREEVSSDVVTDTTILGLSVSITVPDTVTDSAYTIEKTLTGASLSGDVLVTYAARRSDHATELVEVTPATVSDLAGPSVPGNPVGLAANRALAAAPVTAYFAQVTEDTDDGWAAAIDLISTDQVYNIVPLTQDETRLLQFKSHVEVMSDPTAKAERRSWQSHLFSTVVTRYTMDNTVDSAVIKYPAAVQTVEVTHSGGLVALGVVVGDVVTATYNGYLPSVGFASGSVSARIAAISEVGDTVTLTVVADTTLPETLSTGVSLTSLVITSREYTTAALKTAVAAYPSTLNFRRVTNVFADRAYITFDDETNPTDPTVGVYGGGEVTDYEIGGWYMAAILATYRSSLPASTPLANRSLPGVQRLISPFTRIADIDAIIDGGNTVLQQPSGENGGFSCYRSITTDVSSLAYAEETVTVQVDSFARKLRQQFKSINGSTILDEAFFDLFSVNSQAVVARVKDDKEMRSIELIEVREDPDRADTFLASYTVRPYYSAAHIDITIYI